MVEQESADLRDVIQPLIAHAEYCGLLTRASTNWREWIVRDPTLSPYPIDNIRSELHSQKPCFQHAVLVHPYIETRQKLLVDEREVGEYRLITTLNGEDEDDYLIFDQ